MKFIPKQSPTITNYKSSENSLSTNHSLQSCRQDSSQNLNTTPCFHRQNKQSRFLKVTSKVVKQLKFTQNDPLPIDNEQKTSLFSKFGNLCNCVDTQKDQLSNFTKERAPSRLNLLGLLDMEKSECRSRPLTPIGSLVSLLKE